MFDPIAFPFGHVAAITFLRDVKYNFHGLRMAASND